jgi:hypothetical protein
MREGDHQAIGVGAFVALLLRQFWVIALVVTVGSLSALAYGNMQVPIFEASAVVQVRSDAVRPDVEDVLTSRDNLLLMVARHRVFAGAGVDEAVVLLRQAIAVRDLTAEAGQRLGFQPEVAGLVISVRLADAESAARVANDLAQQILDLGNRGVLDADFGQLTFYRGEEDRLWQEVSALQTELQASAGTVATADAAFGDEHRLLLLQDQHDLVRQRLAEQEVAARLDSRNRAGQFSLLMRATSAEAVLLVRNWMLIGVAGSLLLAVTLAFVLERRYPALQRGPWTDFMALRARLAGGYRLIDDPKRPILGLPRFAVVAGVLVTVLVGVAAFIR